MLAIGIVVDDAIVVVEAVQLNIDDGMNPKEATIRALEEVSGAGGRDRLRSVGGVHSGGVSGRHQRPDLPAVCVDDCGFGAAFGIQRAFSEPGVELVDSAAQGTVDGMAGSGILANSTKGSTWTTNRYLFGVRGLIRKSAFALVALVVVYRGPGRPVQDSADRISAG